MQQEEEESEAEPKAEVEPETEAVPLIGCTSRNVGIWLINYLDIDI